jgi:tetratricopeptide (TPR) repeat protein
MDLLGLGLDGLAGWRVVSPRTLLPRARGFSDRSPLSQAVEIARSVGAGRMVLGRVVSNGPALIMNAELYETTTGQRLAYSTARGSLADPGLLIDSLATALAEQHVFERTKGRRRREDYATASPMALKPYLFAEQAMRQGKWQLAADSLRKAIERDSSFGPAWYQLIRAGTWGGAETGFGSDFNILIKGAMRDSARLARRTILVLRAIQAADRGERIVALRRADELLADFPNDPDAALAAVDNYFHYGVESDESAKRIIEGFKHVVALDSGALEARSHLAELYCVLGDTTHGWPALARLVEAAPEWVNMRMLGTAMRAVFRHEDPATLIRAIPQSDISRLGGLLARYALACGNSKPADAVAIADSFTAVIAASDYSSTLNVTATAARYDFFLARGQYEAAWKVLQRARMLDPDRFDVLGRIVLHQLIVGNRTREAQDAARKLVGLPGGARILLLWYHTSQGSLDTDDARSLYMEGFLAREDMGPYRDALLNGLKGLRSLSDGDSAGARRLLLESYKARFPSASASPWAKPDRRFTLALARLEYADGELESALRHLDYAGLLERADGEELRGQIEERRGDTVAALRAYNNFIALWENADPELQPRVAAARAALERLEHR